MNKLILPLLISAVILSCVKKEDLPKCDKITIYFVDNTLNTDLVVDTVKLILNQPLDTSVSKLELQVHRPDTTEIVWLRDTMMSDFLYLGIKTMPGDRIILKDVPTQGRDQIQVFKACRLETPTGENTGCFTPVNFQIGSCDNVVVESN